MDLTYPPEAEAFRAQIRAWPEEHLPLDSHELNGARWPKDNVA